jgi:hypothetical protein
MSRLTAAALIAVAIAVAGFEAKAQETAVARVKIAEGDTFVMRGPTKESLAVGEPIYLSDTVETAAGSLGITFLDGARISVGPNSIVQIKDYQYSPRDGKLAFLVNLLQGTMQYVSGVIEKLAPQSVHVETPYATVAVRGTRFLARVDPE